MGSQEMEDAFLHVWLPFRELSISIFISGRLNSDFKKTQAGFPTMLLSFLEETNSVSFVCMYYIVLFSDVHLGCVAECNYGS